VKTIFPWKFNLEYDGTFTKLFMDVSSRKMFPTTRNLQIRVYVYHPRHYCGDWLTFSCFVPMIADHNLVKKRFGPMIADHDLVNKRLTTTDAEVCTHTFLTMIIEESVCFMSRELFFSQLFLCGTYGIQIYFLSSTEHCTWAIISPKELKFCVTRISFALLYWNTELSDVKYFAICS
jgi:hypothetical protein